MKKLEKYNNKRDFKKTKEPKGEVKKEVKKNSNLKFCVQWHFARREHYDFRLEYDGVLKSWAVPKGPSYDIKERRLAVEVEDHPYSYRNFEGVIPKGEYGGGTVLLFDRGTYEPLNDFKEGLKNGVLKFKLKGKRLKGDWTLVRFKNDDDKKLWLLIKEYDKYTNYDDISKIKTSIKSGLTVKEVTKKYS